MLSKNPRVESRLSCAVNAVVEKLEDRRLLAGNASVVQTLPYTLEFDGERSGMADKDGETTGLTWVQPNKNNNEYQPSLIDLDTTAGRLKLTAAGTATAGGAWENDNTQVNALQTQFNATASGGFTISTRLVGPLGFLKDPSEQGGLVFGPDQDNYVKLVAVAQPNGQSIQFVDETKSGTAFTHSINPTYTNVGAFSSISTLDLYLAGDPSTGTIYAYYKINGGPQTPIAQTLTLSGTQKSAFFSATAKAGIMVMQKNNLAPVTVSFDRFDITPGTPQVSRPSVRGDVSIPGDAATDVWRDAFVSMAVNMPNLGHGINSNTLTKNTVFMYRTSDHLLVDAHLTTSGAGDAIILQPSSPLDANTSYTYEVTAGLKDTGGSPFVPYKASFTTGTKITPTDPNIAFEKVVLPTAQGQSYTSVTVGPDHKLYATTLTGLIQRFTINADGSLGAAQNITTVQTANSGNRLISGLTFDPSSTADNLIAWVAHGYYALEGAPDWSGKISKLTGANLENYQDAITNLPRAARDHVNNQIVFKNGAMYFSQASNSAMGAPDVVWAGRSEHLLNAAVLKVDVAAINQRLTNNQGALNVQTEGLGAGNYNPWANNAPVTLYATGVRNAYDLVWTRAGYLYAPTNGSAAGGSTPGYPNSVFSSQRIDQGTAGPYDGTNVPALTNVNQTENDFLFKIVQNGYYGHPNPTRGEYVLDGGNPTANPDDQEFTAYPVGTQPDRNYKGYAYNFGQSHSPDGIIEYQGGAFGGALDGKLLVTRYSGGADIMVLTPGGDGNITDAHAGIAGLTGFTNPLDLTEDLNSGYLYIADYGAQTITLARPIAPGARIEASKSTLYFNDDYAGNNTTASPTQTVRISNTGTQPLSIPAGGLTLLDTTNWTITSKPNLPYTIPVGGYVDIGVAFKAVSTGGAGIRTTTLTIVSNDQTRGSLVINLRGLATPGTGGQNEASLQRILDLYQIPVNVGDANKANTNLFSNTEPLVSPNDEVVMPRLVKAGPGNVTIEPLATMAGGSPAVRFGYYDAGTPSKNTELLTVAAADAQSVHPTLLGTTSFDPGSLGFGLYVTFPIFGNTAYSEDVLNTKENTVANRRKMRFYALKNQDGTVVPNAYVFTSEDYVNDTNGAYDTNDFMGIIRNVQPAAAGAEIGLENVDGAPFADRLIFNRIQAAHPDLDYNPATGQFDIVRPDNVTHDTSVVRVRNTGSSVLTLGTLSVSNTSAWTILNPPASGTQIAPGDFLDVSVKFVAQSNPPHTGNQTIDPSGNNRNQGGVYTGTLTINSNDADEPATQVQLAGYWQAKSENNMEPNLVTQINLIYGYKTTILNAGQEFGIGSGAAGQIATVGEEVLSRYWTRADTNIPMTVRQLSAFHTQGNTATVRWSAKGSGSSTALITQTGVDGQSFLPRSDASGNPAGAATFTGPSATTANPQQQFRFQIDTESSDDTQNNPVTGQPQDQGHHVRFFPVRDRNGNLVTNQWIMVMDYLGVNYDYQDNVYLVSNMRPAAPAAPAGITAAPQGPGNALDWSDNTDPLLAGYNVYRSTSSTSGFVKVNTSTVTTSDYLDTTAAAGTKYYYKVTAVDSWGGESVASAVVNSTRDADTVPPARPTGLVANGAGNGVQLTWSANTDVDLAGYRVYRSDAAAGTYLPLNSGALVTDASFLDSANQAGEHWYYKVAAVDLSANESAMSDVADAVRIDTTAPAVPTGLTSSSRTDGVKLTWTANTESDLAGYRIYRASSAGGSYAALNGGSLVTGAATYTDGSVSVGVTWFYKVAAVDGSGNESTAAGPVSGARTSFTPVTVRVNVGGSAFTDSQGRTWSPDSGFTGGTVSGGAYDVQGTTDDPMYYSRRFGAMTYAVGVPDGAYTLKLYFADPVYTTANQRIFDVQAEGSTILSNFDIAAQGGGKAALVNTFNVNVTGGALNLSFIKKTDNPIISAIELFNTPASSDTTPPAQPAGLAAAPSTAGIGLTWTANSEPDLAGYNVYRSTSLNGTYVKINSALLTAPKFTDTTATAGAVSYYRVVAMDTTGNASAAASVSATRTAQDTTPPAMPANFAVTSTAGGVRFSWTRNTESDFVGYNLYRSDSPSGSWVKLNVGSYITGTTFSDTSAPIGATSYYRLVAFDKAGNGSAGATTSAVRTS